MTSLKLRKVKSGDIEISTGNLKKEYDDYFKQNENRLYSVILVNEFHPVTADEMAIQAAMTAERYEPAVSSDSINQSEKVSQNLIADYSQSAISDRDVSSVSTGKMTLRKPNVFHEQPNPVRSNISPLVYGPVVHNRGVVNNPPVLRNTRSGVATEIAAETDIAKSLQISARSIDNLIRQYIPDIKSKVIELAGKWYGKDDLLGGIVDLKTMFTITGFSLFAKPKDGTELADAISGVKTKTGSTTTTDAPAANLGEQGTTETTYTQTADIELVAKHAEFQAKLNIVSRKWCWYDTIKQLLTDWYVQDSCILYWLIDEEYEPKTSEFSPDITPPPESTKEFYIPGLRSVIALNPKDVDWDNSFGHDMLKVKIPDQIVQRIREAIGRTGGKATTENVTRLVDEGIPQKFIDAVKKSETMVELKREDGDNWLIKTRERKHYGLANPSMYRIFPQLAVRSLLREGDIATADMMKHFIQHVTTGESVESGPMAGSRNNWARKEDTDALLLALANPNRAARLATNHTCKISFVYPPKEMFDEAKYVKSEKDIYNWGGINVILYTGVGGTYSGGFIGVRRAMALAVDAREVMTWLVSEFFDHPTIRVPLALPDDMDVVAIFDGNVLKDPRLLLDECKWMIESGVGDPRVALRELSRDPDAMRRSKLGTIADNNTTMAWQKVEDARQEIVNAQAAKVEAKANKDLGAASGAEKGGRPKNADTEVGEDTKNQHPTSGTL